MFGAERGQPVRPGPAAWRLRVANDPAELPRVHEWIDGLATAEGLASDVAFAADLCLQEAVGNVIAYAFSEGAAHEISVSATRSGPGLAIEVEDDGLPFDPLGVAPAETADRLEDVRIGGLGIHLIRRFTSEVRYAREGDRNRLTMVIGPEAPRR